MEQIPPFWWTWSQPSVIVASDSSKSATGQGNDEEADSSSEEQGRRERVVRDAAGNGDAVIWISTHSADDAVGNVILPLYSRE
jgi:hypothetical protein